MNVVRTIACLGAFMLALGAQAQVNQQILGEKHAMLRIDAQKKYLLLPVQESQENAHIRVIKNNQLVKTLNCQLAVDKVDYYVPYETGRVSSSTSPSTAIPATLATSAALPAGRR